MEVCTTKVQMSAFRSSVVQSIRSYNPLPIWYTFAIYINPPDKGEFGTKLTNIYLKYVNWGRGLRHRILQLTINKEGRYRYLLLFYWHHGINLNTNLWKNRESRDMFLKWFWLGQMLLWYFLSVRRNTKLAKNKNLISRNLDPQV